MIEVEALTEKSIRVSWTNPIPNVETEFVINVTSLRTFDNRLIDPDEDDISKIQNTSETIQVKVPNTSNQTIINYLKPFTMYEVTVTATNNHGASLPSYAVRTLTLTPGTIKSKTIGEVPKLPDTKKCCADKGINQTSCLNQLCDPSVIDMAEITTYMICAPWATQTFGCLADGLDHTPCCKARGLPDKCQQFCMGNVTVNIDFNVFK